MKNKFSSSHNEKRSLSAGTNNKFALIEKVSIIIPAYNEEKRIWKTLDSNLKFFKKLKKEKILNFEIITVVNGSKDKTLEIVKSFAKKNKELKYLNLKRGAKGYAVIEGFKEALKSNSNLIGFKDADMATKPEAFYDLIQKIGNADGIIASRYIKGSVINPKPAFERIFASRIFNLIIKIFLGLKFKDTQCGAKLFKKNALEKTIPRLTFSQLAFDVDILYNMKKLGFKIKEIPTTWSDEKYSKVNFVKSGPRMALAILRLRIINSRFKTILRPFINWFWGLSK